MGKWTISAGAVLTWCLMASCCPSARADGAGAGIFGDTFAATQALQRGDAPEVIRLYTKALAAGNVPKIAIAPTHVNLGLAYGWMGEYDKGVAEIDIGLRLSPRSAVAHEVRGHVNFDGGRFAAAASDFQQALTISAEGAAKPEFVIRSYDILWLHLARQRAGEDDGAEFSRNAATISPKDSLNTLVAYFLGKSTAKQVMEAVPNAIQKLQSMNACYAAFYLGEDALVRHDEGEANRSLQAARASCPAEYLEHFTIEAELKRLGE